MKHLTLATVAAVLFLGGCGDEADSPSDKSGPRIELPRDDAAHLDEPVEWWYWTGHLEAADERRFGFEFVFFRATVPVEGIMAHVAITDVDATVFSYDSVLQEGSVPAIENAFELSLGGLSAAGGDGEDELHGETGAYSFDLTLEAAKPAVLHHGDGYTDYPEGGYTHYYSRERMAADGTLTVDGESHDVSGSAWFDHQYGDLAPVSAQGWDWFAIQLDDDREIMLFLLHSAGSAELIGGTYTDADGSPRELASGAVSVEAQREWTNGDGDCTYPLHWTVEVEDLTLEIMPVMDDQEVRPAYGPVYWEGAATVQGDATGNAYIELNGHCE
jgi:predicted secreted hydrolase